MKRTKALSKKVLVLISLFLLILVSHVQATTEVEKVYAPADAFFSQKKYEEAINVYLNIVANFHQDAAKAYFMIGRSYFELSNYLEAEKWFRDLVSEFPKKVEPFANDLRNYWAACYYYDKKYEKALEKFLGKGIPGRLIYPLPEDDPWYDMVGRCYEQIGKMGKTLEALSPVSSKYTKLSAIL